MAPNWPSHAVLHQRTFAGAGDAAENSYAERNALAHGLRGRASLSFNFDFLGAVIEQADADMIEAEILLDFADDLAEHVYGIVAGNGGSGNVVEESQLARAALFFGEQARIFDRDGNLSGGGHQNFEIALLEDEFTFGVQCNHHTSGTVSQQNGCGAQAFGGLLGTERDA